MPINPYPTHVSTPDQIYFDIFTHGQTKAEIKHTKPLYFDCLECGEREPRAFLPVKAK